MEKREVEALLRAVRETDCSLRVKRLVWGAVENLAREDSLRQTGTSKSEDAAEAYSVAQQGMMNLLRKP